MLSVSKKRRDMKIKREEGFALVAAILACLILLAVGLVAYFMTTQDSRTSLRTMGDKKAMMATESGVHRIMTYFDAANIIPQTFDAAQTSWPVCLQVNAAADPSSSIALGSRSVLLPAISYPCQVTRLREGRCGGRSDTVPP